MSSAHDLPKAIQWHEGMLLVPQHFQQQSLRSEELVHYHAQMLSPFHWGVRHLKIDPVLLVDGKFRVLEIEAVLPDGLVVSTLHLEGVDLTHDLTEYEEEIREGPLTVHLAVPARVGERSTLKGSLARYESVDGLPVPDQNTGEGEVEVPRLRPRVSLLVRDTVPDKYASFPLAKVSYANETFSLTSFVPPLLRVGVASPLGELCSALASRLREKSVFLSERVRSPLAAQKAPQLLDNKVLIQGMVAALPQFEAVLQTGVSHPYPLYLALCSLVGHLSALGSALVPPVLKPYDHNDLYATFEQAERFVDQVVREGFIESHSAYPFTLDEGTFSLHFDGSWAGRSLVIGLRARPGDSERELLPWIEHSLVGAESLVESLRQKRILGVTPRNVSRGEGELVPTRGVVLVSIPADSEFIVRNERLLIFNPDDPRAERGPAEVVLYVRSPATGR